MVIRVGFGFDAHEFEEGKPLYLGGVYIKNHPGFKAHSDGDVLLHALTDALLSAVGEPDIGELFPDKDPKWKDAPSSLFLKEAVKRVREKGYKIVSVDCVLVMDSPKLSPIKETIRDNLSELLGVDKSFISLKAKTKEGFCKDAGAVCYCVVLLSYEG